jgi:hypothetical protein
MRRSIPATLVIGLALAGCGERSEQPSSDVAAPEQREAVEGVSPEELSERAQPMTPEEARALGVVDTTIQVADEP